MQASLVTAIFLAMLLASLLTGSWLSWRQMRHVAAHRDQVPPAFAARVSAASHRKAADYTVAKLRLGLLSGALGTAVVIGWTLLGGLDLLNAWMLDALATRWGPLAYQIGLLAAFTLIGSLLALPLEWAATFGIEQRFGFNRSSPALFLADQLKALAVLAVVGTPLAALVLWLMHAAGPTWWLWAWAVWVGFNLLLMVVYPTLIAPLFNRFEPLAQGDVAERVQALLTRCGFRASGLFVMDGSRRSAHGNAYFTGLGRAKRVVFFDTLLQRLNPTEIEAVLAHELGHFRLNHVRKRLLGVFALSLGALALLGWLSAQPAFYAGLGVTPNTSAPNDALALLLFSLALPPLGFFASPLGAMWSRRHEFEADAFATRHADAAALASALVKLHEDNASTLTPDPLYVRFHYSHPPAGERLAALGQPPAPVATALGARS